MYLHLLSAFGFLAFAGIAWLFSAHRKNVPWKTVAWGLGLQLLIGLLVLRLPFSRQVFLWLNDAVLALLNVSKSGTAFLFGPLAAGPGESGSIGFILVFQVLPVVIFFSASILSIPAGVVIAKILIPETEMPETLAQVPPEDPAARSRNLMGAIIQGAMDGLKLAAGIAALLIAILGLVALIDKILALPSPWLGLAHPLSLVDILSWIFYPLTALLGITTADIPEAARLLGERVILTEVVSYQDMAQLLSTGKLNDPRTVVILSYGLCGFAHVASVAIFVGGIAALAPSRRDELASLGLRALFAATLATLMTACVAGIFTTGEGVLLSNHG
jgi:CNT family concentrative nucleoside transporter